MGFWSGSPAEFKQVSTMAPNQLAAGNQMLSAGLQQLQQPQFDFAPIEQQARSQFAQKTVPGIAERFSTGGNRGTFAQALGNAGSGLEESLAAMRSHIGLQQQQMNNQRMMSLLGMGMTPQYENVYQPQEQGFLGSAAQGTGSALGKGGLALLLSLLGGAAGSAFGGPFGGAAGGAAGNWLSRLFS